MGRVMESVIGLFTYTPGKGLWFSSLGLFGLQP
jgi:hypothetical protein